jgi:hypothetical protein
MQVAINVLLIAGVTPELTCAGWQYWELKELKIVHLFDDALSIHDVCHPHIMNPESCLYSS